MSSGAGEKPTTAASAPPEKLTNTNSQNSLKPSDNFDRKSSILRNKFKNIKEKNYISMTKEIDWEFFENINGNSFS